MKEAEKLLRNFLKWVKPQIKKSNVIEQIYGDAMELLKIYLDIPNQKCKNCADGGFKDKVEGMEMDGERRNGDREVDKVRMEFMEVLGEIHEGV